MNTQSRMAAAALLAVLASAAAGPDAWADPMAPTQRRTDHAEHRAQERLKHLAAAIQLEKRDPAWAGRKEAHLRASFLRRGLSPGALKSIECRTTRCLVELQVSAEPTEALKQVPAVQDWLAVDGACAYTMVSRLINQEGAPGTVQVYFHCGR